MSKISELSDGGSLQSTDYLIAVRSGGNVKVQADGTVTGTTGSFSGNVSFADNAKAIFGAGSDLQIYHDGTDSIIDDNGTGSLKLQTGASTKLEVTSTGIDVTGTVTADGLTVDTDTLYVDATNNRVGVGTTSPASKLSIAAGDLLLDNTRSIIFKDSGGVARSILQYYSDNSTYLDAPNGSTIFRNGASNTEKMRIDSSGALGLGTTPPTTSAHPQMFIGTEAVILGNASGALDIGNNLYYNSGWKYRTTGAGSLQNFDASGNIAFYRVASGTADTAVTLDESARIDSSGNLLVGTTDSIVYNEGSTGNSGVVISSDNYYSAARKNAATLFLNRQASDGAIAQFYKDGTTVGSISVTSSATSYNTSSDQRLKENIADAESASELIDAIQVRSFDWKADGSHQRYGMVAQELLEVAPEAVSQPEDPEAMMGVDYSKLVPMLVKEIQSLRARVAQLEGA